MAHFAIGASAADKMRQTVFLGIKDHKGNPIRPVQQAQVKPVVLRSGFVADVLIRLLDFSHVFTESRLAIFEAGMPDTKIAKHYLFTFIKFLDFPNKW